MQLGKEVIRAGDASKNDDLIFKQKTVIKKMPTQCEAAVWPHVIMSSSFQT
jgi:hypothetical protein